MSFTIVDSTVINVLNFSDSYTTIATSIKPEGYLFPPSLSDEPYAIPLSFSEIRVVNSQSNVFREGILRFESEFEKEVYTKLGIRDWEQILSDKQIRDIILKPTKDGLDRFVKVTSSSLFERIRGMLIMLENTGMYDISMRVKNLVNTRHQELQQGNRISEIKIQTTSDEMVNANEQKVDDNLIAKLKEEIMEQIKAEQLAEFKKSLESQIREEMKTEAAKVADSSIKTADKQVNKRNVSAVNKEK